MALPSLTGYLGPAPLWAWIALGGGGLYLYEKHKGGASGGTGLFGGVLTSSTNQTGLNPDGTQDTGPADNQDWGQEAINALIAQGYDGLQASSAVQSYLDGGTLDPSYNSLISAAIKTVGPAPDVNQTSTPTMPTPNPGPVAPLGNATGKPATPKPTNKKVNPTPAPKPSNTSSYKIKSGDTLSAIAKKNHTTVSALTKLNNIKDPNKIYAGHSIKIPK